MITKQRILQDLKNYQKPCKYTLDFLWPEFGKIIQRLFPELKTETVKTIESWANDNGLGCHYNQYDDTVIFYVPEFNPHHPPQTTKVMKQTDGTIIEFLAGSHSYDGLWFGESNLEHKGQFWWRPILREFSASQNNQGEGVLPEFSQYLVEEINGYQQKRDGWKEESKDYAAYDLVVRVLRKVADKYISVSSSPLPGTTVQFNKQLTKEVKDGKLSIENTDDEILIRLLRYIYPDTIEPECGMRFYERFNDDEWVALKVTELPSRPVQDFINTGLTIQDYEEVLADHRRLVRELDVIINGDNAAEQASLCDIVAQLQNESHPSAVQAEALREDMTAQEFFNHPDGMFTLDFLTEEERETLYKAIDLFAAGKGRNALSAPQDEGWIKIVEGGDMPEEDEDCLVWTELAKKSQASTYKNKQFYRYSNAVESDRMALYYFPVVTHWRKLPSPPTI